MKKFRLLSLALVIFSGLSITSCDTEPVDPVLNDNLNPNNPDNPNNPNPESGVFKVDFNGSTHTAISTVAILGDDLIQIVGVLGTNGESIALGIAGTPEVGATYPIDDMLLAYNANSEDEASYVNFSDTESSGDFEITAIDTTNKTISGTFSFTGWYGDGSENPPSIVFTNGTFTNIPYTGGTPTTPEDNAFSAKIDGVATDYADDVLGAYASTMNDEGLQEYVVITAVGDYKITIQTDYEVAPGTYQFTGNILNGTPLATFEVDGIDYEITGGSLTITTSTDEHIVGTFNFTVKNDLGQTIHTVTNGVFDIYF